CFNIDPVAWKSLSSGEAGFDGMLAVNMSLGLTMTSDPSTQNTLVCGPTIPTACKHITMYNGVCIELDRYNRVTRRFPSVPQCKKANIAFLLDGSGSVSGTDFTKMKEFVTNLITLKIFNNFVLQFAVAQFSNLYTIYFDFTTYSPNDWEIKVDNIRQLGGRTYTAEAIKKIVREVFSGVSASNVDKILIVITDGKSDYPENLPSAIDDAKTKNIVRYAIGVGSAFKSSTGKDELYSIASDPRQKHVFQVESFQALENIRKTLQSQIFPIEGSQTGGNTLKMEMSQEGFSAAYGPMGIQMGIVGANQWKGGYKRYNNSASVSYGSEKMEPDSYLGYSMAVATTTRGALTILGGPRYQHRGAVEVVSGDTFKQLINPSQLQVCAGEYFGAVLCAMDVDNDSFSDLILISSPMYKEADREGRVYVCTIVLLNIECSFERPSSQTILRGDPTTKGRFGSALAVLPDLNMDTFNDLAVGAPLEDDGQGSIYIFHGERDKIINPSYSQRISASEVQSGLKFFGVSFTQWSSDQSGDGLPDLVVGSKGTVVFLRSRPIVTVEPSVTFSPEKNSTQEENCSKDLKTTARVCFIMKTRTAVDTAQAKITYTLTLDATRKLPNSRAYIAEKQRHQTSSLEVGLGKAECQSIEFFIQACPEDALNPLNNKLSFTFEGLPSSTNLRPSLGHQSMTTSHPMEFEISCGADQTCMDNLKVDFNFSSSALVKVGIDELVNVTVSLENREENSYNSHVTLTYPAGISYRKFTIIKGRIECNSSDSEDGKSRGNTLCTVDKPIFKSKSKAIFIVSYGIETNSKVGRQISITANAYSGNQQHSSLSELYKKKEIDVKYSILVTIEGSHIYRNFSFGKDLKKPFQQSAEVTNNFRALNLTVVIEVPIKLGDKDIWGDGESLQIPDCESVKDDKPTITDFTDQVKKTKIVDCSVATCRTFKCRRFMEKQEKITHTISANLTSGWIEQIGLSSSRFLLISTVSLEYDQDQYIFFSTTSTHKPPVRKLEAEVEIYSEPDFTKEIVGGSLGGLAFVALVTAGLYKAGFFKRKYSQMINENANAADPDADPDTGAPPEAEIPFVSSAVDVNTP
uniref:VWFA domain-containing protein n=1 Tax=Oryzias latipes TaxID=8090 RepID=A0A3B3HP47_ORYLA